MFGWLFKFCLRPLFLLSHFKVSCIGHCLHLLHFSSRWTEAFFIESFLSMKEEEEPFLFVFLAFSPIYLQNKIHVWTSDTWTITAMQNSKMNQHLQPQLPSITSKLIYGTYSKERVRFLLHVLSSTPSTHSYFCHKNKLGVSLNFWFLLETRYECSHPFIYCFIHISSCMQLTGRVLIQ